MNVFNKVAMQGLKKNHTRTFVTIIGVALAAALFTGVFTFAVSLQNYMINGASLKYGSWHVELPDSDLEFVKDLANDNNITENIMLQNMGYAELKESKNENKPYLFISGWDKKAFDTLPIKMISGRLPENDNEVLIPFHLMSNGGVEISEGETITLTVGNRINKDKKLGQHDSYSAKSETFEPVTEKTYTVVGICQRPAIEEFIAPGYTLITMADNAFEGSLSVFITLNNPYKISSYVKDIENRYSYILNENVLRFMGLSGEKWITIMLFAIVIILVILVVVGSVFLIYNAFNISLNERTRQFGILMSVGATAKQLRNSVLFEGICIGIIGIPVGILLGIPAIKFVLFLVEKNFANVMYDNVELKLVLSIPAIVIAAAVSLVTILISAYIPAKKAASMQVMDCIRQSNDIKVEADKLKVSKFSQMLFGLESMLAIKNFKRNKRRYRSIILSLTFSVVLFVGASTFGNYLNQVAKNSNQVVEEYDIVFSTKDVKEDEMLEFYDEFKNVSGVTASAYQADMTYPCLIKTSDISKNFTDTFGEFIKIDNTNEMTDAILDVVFVDDGTYKRQLKSLGLSDTEYTGQDNKMIMVGFVEGYLYMQDESMEITLCDKNGSEAKNINVTYVNDYPDLLPADAGETFKGYSLLLIAPYEIKPQFDALGTAVKSKIGMTFQSDNPGKSKSQMQTIIESNGIAAQYSLINLYEIMEQNRNIAFIINLFAAVFIMMITLIAIVNVFNTISTNIKLRRRELAMLRSVGMSDKDFNRMMRFECVLYGARTMLWGLPISIIISCLIYKGMISGGGFEIKFIFPYESIGASIIGVFLIVFITMLYATSKIKKENIIDALRDDMT